jgi:hypothetical protein
MSRWHCAVVTAFCTSCEGFSAPVVWVEWCIQRQALRQVWVGHKEASKHHTICSSSSSSIVVITGLPGLSEATQWSRTVQGCGRALHMPCLSQATANNELLLCPGTLDVADILLPLSAFGAAHLHPLNKQASTFCTPASTPASTFCTPAWPLLTASMALALLWPPATKKGLPHASLKGSRL